MSNNNAELFSRPQTEARIHDLEQFCLFAEAPDRPGFRARLQFGERNGAPRITMFTAQAEGPKVAFVGFKPEIFELFLMELEEVAKGPAGADPRHLANYDRDPNEPRDKPNPAKVVRNHLVIGKDNDGVVWIGIKQKDVKNVRFKFLISDWHAFVKADGTPMSAEESSARYTLAYINSLRRAYAAVIGRLRPWFDPSKSKKKTESASSSGNTSAFSTFDDDVGF